MANFVVGLLVHLALCLLIRNTLCYEPTWDSLDTRPLPSWYDEAKLGIFIHWGVFSVPSFASEWFWWKWQGQPTRPVVDFMAANYKPDFTYADFAKDFTTEFFDASEWAELFQSSGARYIVFVSKHHEGFTNWPSKYSFNWNSQAVGPNRDIVGELMNATRGQTDLRFGLYHSLFEWFNPLYIADRKSGFVTQDFVNHKTMPELYELVNTYKPEIVWSDGDHEASDTYWKSKEFLAWLYTDSPVKDTVVVNDRWGKNISCHHGDVFTCKDRYNPGQITQGCSQYSVAPQRNPICVYQNPPLVNVGVLQKHKWVNAMTIDRRSWGFRRNAPLSDYLTIEELLQTFITTVSCRGNMLMNVGPPSHGHITPIYEERLHQMGSWLKVNGEGIYSSKPWTYQNDTLTKDVWYTAKYNSSGTNVYAFIFDWPSTSELSLGLPKISSATIISLLGYPENFSYNPRQPAGVDILIPAIPFNKLPCQWLWVFKITAVEN